MKETTQIQYKYYLINAYEHKTSRTLHVHI